MVRQNPIRNRGRALGARVNSNGPRINDGHLYTDRKYFVDADAAAEHRRNAELAFLAQRLIASSDTQLDFDAALYLAEAILTINESDTGQFKIDVPAPDIAAVPINQKPIERQ